MAAVCVYTHKNLTKIFCNISYSSTIESSVFCSQTPQSMFKGKNLSWNLGINLFGNSSLLRMPFLYLVKIRGHRSQNWKNSGHRWQKKLLYLLQSNTDQLLETL